MCGGVEELCICWNKVRHANIGYVWRRGGLEHYNSHLGPSWGSPGWSLVVWPAIRARAGSF